MIRVLLSHGQSVEADAILRSVTSDLDPVTPFSRELELHAGPEVLERLQGMGELPVGAAVITPGGNLSSPFLIHVVLQSPEEPVTIEGVRLALLNGLRRAGEWGLARLVLPPLGTGPGNLDAQESASVMVPLISHHIQHSENPREVVILVGTEYEEEVFTRLVEVARRAMSAPEN
jgi:O-acetyl-ADP-ribose deacetylase (regulator of RNase III)